MKAQTVVYIELELDAEYKIQDGITTLVKVELGGVDLMAVLKRREKAQILNIIVESEGA